MSLGETIHRLRTEQNLSQDGLADALGVSRQSISKWETNRSVPDLDKLVKLSGVFGVTLDELVLGERPAPAPDPVPPAPPPHAAFPPRKIAGAILLCMGFLVVLSCTLLGSLLAGAALRLSLLLCGAVCFLLRTHTGLWCAWAVCIPVDVYLRYATGIDWRLTLFTPHFQPSMNYIRLAVAWGQLAAMVLLVFLTAVLLRKKRAGGHPPQSGPASRAAGLFSCFRASCPPSSGPARGGLPFSSPPWTGAGLPCWPPCWC